MTLPAPVATALDSLNALMGTNTSKSAARIAAKTVSYANSVAKGEISAEEAADLIEDLKVEALVASSADELSDKIMLQKAVANLVAVLSLIPIP